MTKIVIAIVTYMRPIGLERLLIALKKQKLLDTYLEVIVIDNDCTGNNQKVIENLYEDYPFKLTLVEEPVKGIVAARNRAVEEFLKIDSDYLVFIDDDEWPVDENWVMSLKKAREENQCDIVYSDVHVVPETSEVGWVSSAFRPKQKKKTVTRVRKFYTGNLLVSRNVFESISPAFDVRFSLTGSSDIHFAIKCNQAGFIAIYTPFAPVEEIFPFSKATFKWFFLRGYRSGEGETRAYLYEGSFPRAYLERLGMVFIRFGYAVKQLILAGVFVDKSRLANALLRLGSAVGTFAGFFNLSYNEYKTVHGK